MKREDEIRVEEILRDIYEQWGPKLELMPGGTIVMTGSDHGYTQWTIAPVAFVEDYVSGDSRDYGITEGQVGMVVADDADDTHYQIVAAGSGKVSVLPPISVNNTDPRAPLAADFEAAAWAIKPGEQGGRKIAVFPRKLRSDYGKDA